MGSFHFVFFGIILLIMVIDLILFVFFGQKTVRKLRKNPATKDALGIELMSGWDILHVMDALALPRWLTSKVRKSGIGPYFPDAEILKQHVTKFDIRLAKVVLVLWVTWVLLLFILMILDKIGVFE